MPVPHKKTPDIEISGVKTTYENYLVKIVEII